MRLKIDEIERMRCFVRRRSAKAVEFSAGIRSHRTSTSTKSLTSQIVNKLKQQQQQQYLREDADGLNELVGGTDDGR